MIWVRVPIRAMVLDISSEMNEPAKPITPQNSSNAVVFV